MRKIINRSIIIFLILIVALNVKANAASFTATVSKKTLNIGETVSITVKADNAAGMYSITSSDTSILELSNGDSSEFIDNTTATVTFKAKKAGTAVIKAIPTDMTDNDDSNKSITGSKSFTITVKDNSTTSEKNTETDSSSQKTTTKSSNANLSTLGVTPKKYDFSGFTKTKTEYSVTIPNDVDSLKVSYKTADSKASVKISSSTGLAVKSSTASGFEVGTNKIEVIVTAEDGKTTKTYTINVTKLATEDEKLGNVIEDENGEIYLTSLSLDGIEISPEFEKDVYSYTATMEGLEKSSIEVKAVANNEKANIEISGNDKLTLGENIINIVLTLEGSSEQKVYQITLNVEEKEEVATIEGEVNSQDSGIINNLMNNIKMYAIIAIAVFVFIIVLIIILICLIKKEKKNENEEDYEDDVKEYNVYENDSNEFEEKIQGQSIEYSSNEIENNNIIEKSRKKEKGKHSK